MTVTPLRRPEPEKDPVKAAQDALEGAVRAAREEAEAKVEAADTEAAEAIREAEVLREELAEYQVGVKAVVLDQADRLHREARHGGPLAFCSVRSCTAWTDLVRHQGWGG